MRAGTSSPAGGVRLHPAEMLLANRAREFLASGPADVVPLIEYICQMPGAPRRVAEHMARALFGDRDDFVLLHDGRWRLADALEPSARAVPPPSLTPSGETALLALDYAVVDVETTGTRLGAGDRITEIAIFSVRNGAVAGSFESLVNPERPIPRYISALTHITWEMVKNAPRFADICEHVLRALEGAIFVAHNAQFDWRFISAEVERVTGRRLDGRRLCTVRLARKVLPQLRTRRLDSVALHYGVEITHRHRAGGDALATAQVLVRMLRDAESFDIRCWADLERVVGRMLVRSRRRRRRSALPRWMDRDTTA